MAQCHIVQNTNHDNKVDVMLIKEVLINQSVMNNIYENKKGDKSR